MLRAHTRQQRAETVTKPGAGKFLTLRGRLYTIRDRADRVREPETATADWM
ncbi:MAG: hypothetical protein ACM3ML_19115 [Micromonosporaceae bacterium]